MYYTTVLEHGLKTQECQLVLGFQDDGVRVCGEGGGLVGTLTSCVGALRQGDAYGYIATDDNEMMKAWSSSVGRNHSPLMFRWANFL